MTTLLTMMFISTMISLLITVLAVMMSEKSTKEREKMTPFECGFSPFKKARSPFSLRFFMTTLIFLIFDIEIAVLLPIGVISKTNNLLTMKILAMLVSIILLVGLLYEWEQSNLEWVE